STVPAIVVLSPSLAKRVMRWMPDWPAVSFAQLSALPAPSEVMTPMPVTTTIGRPFLSCADAISSLLDRLDQRPALAAPMTDGGNDDPIEAAIIATFDTGRIGRREQLFVAKRERCKGNIHGELRLEPVPKIGRGRAHWHISNASDPGALLA